MNKSRKKITESPKPRKTGMMNRYAPGSLRGVTVKAPDPEPFPIPAEWDQFIPPSMIKTVDYSYCPITGKRMLGTGPAWNKKWLIGLEKYIRSIVKDEMMKRVLG